MNGKRILAHASLLGATLIYGANYTIAKEVLNGEYISPMGLVFFRVLSSAILFLFIHFIFIKEKIERSDLFRLAICGFFGVLINQSFFITGLKYTTPINASVLMVMTPIFVLIISILLKEEKASLFKVLGIVLGASGTLLLIFSKGNISFDGTLKGDIFILINAFSYGLYLVLVKPLMSKYNALTVVKWIFLFGLIPVIPIGWEGAFSVDWSIFTSSIWFAFLYVLILTTFLAYLLNASALKKVKPTTVGVYIYLQPVLATIVALSLGKDQLTLLKIIAGIIIILGVYLVSFSRKKAKASS